MIYTFYTIQDKVGRKGDPEVNVHTIWKTITECQETLKQVKVLEN